MSVNRMILRCVEVDEDAAAAVSSHRLTLFLFHVQWRDVLGLVRRTISPPSNPTKAPVLTAPPCVCVCLHVCVQ